MCLFLFIGQLLGVDYLLSQARQPLKVLPKTEEADDMLEDVDEGDEDEGFEENVTDMTLSGLLDDPVPSPLPACCLPSPPAASSSQPALHLPSRLCAAAEPLPPANVRPLNAPPHAVKVEVKSESKSKSPGPAHQYQLLVCYS